MSLVPHPTGLSGQSSDVMHSSITMYSVSRSCKNKTEAGLAKPGTASISIVPAQTLNVRSDVHQA